MSMFCKKYMECPGRARPQGDGTCPKVHSDQGDAKIVIKAGKDKKKAAGEVAE